MVQAAPSATRRSVLAGSAAATASLAGCTRRLRTVLGRDTPDRITLTIKTVPVDEDPFALLLARRLAEWFQSAGLGARVVPMDREEMLRQVLVNHEFDVFVGRYPDRVLEPDGLVSLLHSRYAAEQGWQNPFGFADLAVDDHLERQRVATGSDRADAVNTLQHTILSRNPLTVLGFPDAIRTARDDRFAGFAASDLAAPLGLLGVDRAEESADTLRATTTDARPTQNLNPLVAALRRRGTVTELLYDSLARSHMGTAVPWLAAEWAWTQSDPPTLDVTLREDLTWHDGESLTPGDVAFTFQFMQDTSLGEAEQTVPSMRHRGRSALVERASVRGERTVRLEFAECNRPVARRALTVPILPAHVWRDRTSEATIGGVDAGGDVTEALVTDNVPAVGSGPLAFDSASGMERLVLERFDDHFLRREDVEGVSNALAGGPAFETFALQYAGADQAAVELVESGEADLTLSEVGPSVVRRIGRSDDLDLLVHPSKSFYFAGYNTRRAPFGNPRFRQLLARLVDRDALVSDVFSDFATPAVTPLAGTRWVPEDLVWDGADPVAPFIGSDGEVDTEQARAAFREAGYRYDDSGRLLQG